MGTAVGTVFIAEKLWRRNRVAAVALMVAVNVATAGDRSPQLLGCLAAAVGTRAPAGIVPDRYLAGGVPAQSCTK